MAVKVTNVVLFQGKMPFRVSNVVMMLDGKTTNDTLPLYTPPSGGGGGSIIGSSIIAPQGRQQRG